MRNLFPHTKMKPARPWQPRWWRENPERWRWAGAIAIVFMLMGAFAYRNPEIWQTPAPMQLAQENGAQIQTPTAVPAETTIPEPPQPLPEEAVQATAQGPQSQPEPEGPEDEVVAVSTPPSQWQQPGYGEWQRAYGYALDPTYNDYRFHHGQDMGLTAGSPVFATASGRVSAADADARWGGVVIIEHGGGWQSVYKCVEPQIKPGAEVSAGEQIGVVLPAPPAEIAQGDHLHFEMLLEGASQDPQGWL